MQEIDDNIKQALQSNIQRIDDDDFAQIIVTAFVAKKHVAKCKTVFQFSSFIIGLSALIGSIGLLVVLLQNFKWLKSIDIKVEDGLILVVIISIFLIFKLLDEIILVKISGRFID